MSNVVALKKKPSKLESDVAAALGPVVTPEREAALLNAALHAPAPLPGVAQTIEPITLAELHESPTNPRKTFANMEKLTASIKSTGVVLVPLIVRAREAGGYEVIAGARRLRAAKKAGLVHVPCDVRELDDTQAREIQITENLQREGISDIEEAEAFESLQDVDGYSVEEIATKMGVSLGTVYARLKLRSLCKEAREALAERDEFDQPKLHPSVAVPLARIPSHALQVKALKTLAGMKAREGIAFIQSEFCQSLRGAPFDLKDATIVFDAGACTACPKNSAAATPGTFDDMPAKGGAFCTDTACFRLKCAANWKAIASASKKAGAEVLTLEEGAQLYAHGNLGHASKYTELDTPNHADRNKRTFREFYERLPEDKRPALIICPDRSQRIHELVDANALLKALAAEPNPPKWALAEVEQKEARKEERKEEKEERGARELRERVTKATVQKLAASLPVKLDEATLRFILIGLADRWLPQAVLDAMECKDRDAYEKFLTKAGVAELNGALLCWGSYAGDFVEATDAYAEPLKKLAKLHGVDMKQIEKAIETGDAAESLMKKKGDD